jgi:hypothetical protein
MVSNTMIDGVASRRLNFVELKPVIRWKQKAQIDYARVEDAEYRGHSLPMLERIAFSCGVALRLHAEKKPDFDREVTLV